MKNKETIKKSFIDQYYVFKSILFPNILAHVM